MSLLEKIAARSIQGKAAPEGEDAQPNALVLGVLKSFGFTPEKLMSTVSEVIAPLTEELKQINARLSGIESRLTDLETNQVALLKNKADEDALAQMELDIENARREGHLPKVS